MGDDDVKGNQEGQEDQQEGLQTEPAAVDQQGGGQAEDPQGQVSDGPADYRALLYERDSRIRELEAQVAEAAESREAAGRLREEIEALRASAEEERTAFELRLAGALDVKAARAVLGDHGGKVEQLKADLPWMFGQQPAQGGATGLPPAGASGGDDAARNSRWEAIAGLPHETKE